MVLFVRAKRIIDVSLQVNGQMRNPQDGSLDMHQAMHQLILTLHAQIQQLKACVDRQAKIYKVYLYIDSDTYLDYDTTGNSQIPVKPGVPDSAAIALYTYLQAA